MEGILPQRNGGTGKQGPPDTAQHAPDHQYGGVWRGKTGGCSRAEKDHYTGERHREEGVRHTGIQLREACVVHCQHEQQAMPAGHRREQAVPAIGRQVAGLPDTGELWRNLCTGIRAAERRIQVLVRGGGNRRTEQAQRAAQDERPCGGEPVCLFP